MAKPDSNFVYCVTKTGGRNKLWKSVRAKYAPCYVRKGPVLRQKHTRARRRRQHREWIQCLILQLIGKQIHVTKLEFYRLFEMSLKLFPVRSRNVNICRVSHTLEHATYICPCEKHGLQCCHAVCETFPRKDETGWEGRRRFHVNTKSSDTHTHARDPQGWQHCVVIPLAKHLAGTKGKVVKVKECVVRRQGTKEGQTKVR
jgi:hypothetical protein